MSSEKYHFKMPEIPNVVNLGINLGEGLVSKREVKFPVYPSCFISVPDDKYMLVADDLGEKIKLPCIYFDGEVIIVPEEYTELVRYLEEVYDGKVTAKGMMKEHEFASLAIRAGIEGSLVSLGDAIFGLDGTAYEMLSKAEQTPEKALKDWRELYHSSMNEH
ncbi:hypothetical protein DC915_RS03320 [Vibrio parahaemolyticus]|nr:hypothetical protein [Vibrio parahaemolyticus]EJG0010010.1 hypothetical protein [Vibrio parahaemolyticus]